MWDFDPLSSCAFPSCMVLFWMLVPSCSLWSQQLYWKNIMVCQCSCLGDFGIHPWDLSLLYLMVGYVQNMVEFVLIILQKIFLNCTIKYFFFVIIFSNLHSFALTRWVDLTLFSIVSICSCRTTNQTELTLVLCLTRNYLGGPEFDVSIFLLKSLGVDPFLWLLRSNCSLFSFFLIKMDFWKGISPVFQHAASILP